ncbi:MAG: glycosyltransferase family 4 protein [Armatimonadetes bacterium]|nr:glycosyltransferase family 4 protein [Armatimonadota bacterium]
MRICFISPYLLRFPRGIERCNIDLANAMARLGESVSILTWNEPGGKLISPLDPEVRLYKVPYVRYLQEKWAIPFYAAHLIAHRYDAVVIFFAGHGEAEGLWLARKFRSVPIYVILGYPYELVPRRYEEFRRFGLDRALISILPVSPALKPKIEEFFGREALVIPNGVDTTLFDPTKADDSSLRKHLGIGPEDPVLLTVAALEERKGVQHMIAALPTLLESGLPVHYVVLGDGPYRPELEALAARLGVSGSVRFVGIQSDVQPYYKMASVSVLLSYGDAFPAVLLETWAMGVPLMVSRRDPYPSIVPEGIGYMVDETDSGAVKETLIPLLVSRELRQRIGQRVRRHAEETYSWPTVASRYREVFASGS